MLIYLVLYVGVILTALLDVFSPLPKDTRRFFFLFWFFCFFVFKAFRWDTGTDWSQYLLCFNESEWSNIFSYNRNVIGDTMMEPGYVFLNVFIRSIFPFYTAFLIITNLIIMLFYTRFYNSIFPRYSLQSLALFLFVTELFPVRQTIAVAIFCFAYYQIKNRSFIKYLLIVLICSTIHYSSFVMIPFYFVLKLKLRLLYYIFGYLIAGVIAERFFSIIELLIQVNILPPVVQHLLTLYGNQESNVARLGDFSGSFWPSYIFHFSLFLITYFCYKKSCIYESEDIKDWKRIGLNSYFFTICFICFHSIPGSSDLLRFQSFFWIGYILMNLYSIVIFVQFKKKMIAIALLTIVCLWKMSGMGIFRPNSLYHYLFVPYKSVLEMNEKQRSEEYYR